MKEVDPSPSIRRRPPVRVPAGGKVEVRLRAPRRLWLRNIELTLNQPAKGMTLHGARIVPDGLAFHLRAAGDVTKPGFADNLIVEATTEWMVKRKGKKGGKTDCY